MLSRMAASTSEVRVIACPSDGRVCSLLAAHRRNVRPVASGFSGLRFTPIAQSRCRISRPSARARLKAAGLRW